MKLTLFQLGILARQYQYGYGFEEAFALLEIDAAYKPHALQMWSLWQRQAANKEQKV